MNTALLANKRQNTSVLLVAHQYVIDALNWSSMKKSTDVAAGKSVWYCNECHMEKLKAEEAEGFTNFVDEGSISGTPCEVPRFVWVLGVLSSNSNQQQKQARVWRGAYVAACHTWIGRFSETVSRFSETVGRFSFNSSAFHPLGRNILPCHTWATSQTRAWAKEWQSWWNAFFC